MKNNKIVTANRVIYQAEIFPELKLDFGYLTNKHEQLIQMLDLINLNEIYPRKIWDEFFGRPPVNRHSFVIAFIAKAMWNIAKTKDLIAYLEIDKALRVICGFDGRNNVIPSEAALIDYKRNRTGELNGEFIGNQVNRYKKRTFAESLFSQLKMNHLPSYILYRGIEKVRSVLNFALAVITATQIIKYA